MEMRKLIRFRIPKFRRTVLIHLNFKQRVVHFLLLSTEIDILAFSCSSRRTTVRAERVHSAT